MNILIVGLGNMGKAIAKVLVTNKTQFTLNAKVLDNSDTFLKDTKALKIAVHSNVNKLITKNYDVILLAVKPNVISSSIIELKSLLQKQIHNHPPLILSVVAGMSTKYIAQLISLTVHTNATARKKPYTEVVRLMPTLAVQKKQSITAISPGIHTTQQNIQRALTIAESFGQVIKIKENLMDAFTAVASSGIAFAASFIDSLTQAGISEGMPKTQAYTAALQATKGALALLESIPQKQTNTPPTFTSPADLICAVSSPKGTTQAGMYVLQNKTKALSTLVQNAVHAANKRSQDISNTK